MSSLWLEVPFDCQHMLLRATGKSEKEQVTGWTWEKWGSVADLHFPSPSVIYPTLTVISITHHTSPPHLYTTTCHSSQESQTLQQLTHKVSANVHLELFRLQLGCAIKVLIHGSLEPLQSQKRDTEVKCSSAFLKKRKRVTPFNCSLLSALVIQRELICLTAHLFQDKKGFIWM